MDEKVDAGMLENRAKFKKFDMSEEDLRLLDGIAEITPNAMAYEIQMLWFTRKAAMINFYLAKTIEKSTNDIIESNIKMAKSNDKHNFHLKLISVAMMILAAAQVIVAWIALGK